jgi:hypothetical protein
VSQVQGYCPMGCGETLFLGVGGYVTCAKLKCPRPDAVSTILDHRETEHIVKLLAKDFSIIHPLRERIDEELLNCKLHQYLIGLNGPPHKPGRYRVTTSRRGTRIWEPLDPEVVTA